MHHSDISKLNELKDRELANGDYTYILALTNTIQQLKKANCPYIPTKKYVSYTRTNTEYGICNCGAPVLSTDYYCNRCGQLLEWGAGET